MANYMCCNPACKNVYVYNAQSVCVDCKTTTKQVPELKDVACVKKAKADYFKKQWGNQLTSDKMTESDLKELIAKDMSNLAMHEAGSGWMRLGTLISGNSTDQMLGAGFKALIDQNDNHTPE